MAAVLEFRMILLSVVSLVATTGVVRSQPVACTGDMHCNEGFFCHTLNHFCHECLSCDLLRRAPASEEHDCISSVDQCGPCLQGLITDEVNWGATCLAPEDINTRWLPSYTFFVITGIATCVLLNALFIHAIWNTYIIVSIDIPSSKKLSGVGTEDAIIVTKAP